MTTTQLYAVLHDLNLMNDKNNDLNVEIQVSITGKDVRKLQEPYILTSYYKRTLLEICKELNYPNLAHEIIKETIEDEIRIQ